ncbi:MAG: hypothetical protein ACE5OR_14240, partial [bacterium]
MSLSDVIGEPEVWIAFLFGSDYSVTLEGTYLDEVLLRKDSDCECQNDECDQATVVAGIPFTDSINTRICTSNPGDPVLSCADGGGGKTVWYTFTPTDEVFVSINTRGSSPDDYDTALGLFTGSCGGLVEIACNDDIRLGVIRQSEILFLAQAGVTYTIHVAEWNGGGPSGGVPTGGDLVFNVEETTPPPLFQGPESGSIAGGAAVSTDDFPRTPSSLTGRPGQTRRVIPLRDIKLKKDTKKPLIEPTGPVGSNFVEDSGEPSIVTDLPNLLIDFAGIPDLGTTIPPDPHMAAGPDHIMATVNSQFGIFDKSGTLLKLIDADAWFSTVLPDASPCDPQIVYDHHSGRWVMTWIECGGAATSLLLSVSDDDNPLGIWCTWRLPGDVNGGDSTGFFNDYAKLGLDEDALYVTANMFDAGFQYVQLRIIPKAQLVDNLCGNPSALNSTVFTTVPAVTFGTPGVEYLVDVDFIHDTGTFMNLWSLSDPLGTPTLTAVTVPVTAFTSPPDADQLGGGTPLIDVGGRRNRNVVYKDGSVWTAHSVGDPTGQFARARYVRIDVATATATEDVAFGLDNYWYYYPAIQPDGNNNVVIAFTRSGFSEYASARFTGVPDGGAIEPSTLLKAGEDNYVKTFGGDWNRWGDYNGIALDPADANKVWMFVEYAAQSVGPGPDDDRWGTWFGEVTFAESPGNEVLAWVGCDDFYQGTEVDVP